MKVNPFKESNWVRWDLEILWNLIRIPIWFNDFNSEVGSRISYWGIIFDHFVTMKKDWFDSETLKFEDVGKIFKKAVSF